MRQKLVCLLLSLLAVISSTYCLPQVCLSKNKCLQGILMAGFRSKKFQAFMGIPYAQPPINDLRFKVSVDWLSKTAFRK